MNRQERYRRAYAGRTPGWQDSLAIYSKTVEGYARPGARILDVGCGHADFLAHVYAGARFVVGADPDIEALERNGTIPRRVAARADDLPFRDGSFDLVVLAWVVEHLAAPERAFREIHRVLAPGGRVVFLTPNAWNYNVWLIRLIPDRFHDYLTRRLYARGERDTFPVQYRLNSPPRIDGLLGRLGFERASLRLNGDPSYVSFNDALFRVACLIERVRDRPRLRRARVHLIGVYRKPPAGIPIALPPPRPRTTGTEARAVKRKLEGAVVVITGASSGMGRATALEFARRGASVVLAARRGELLERAAEECRRLGARAVAVPTDVTDPDQVAALARRAVEELGRIDVWVNNAGVTLLGRFEEAPLAANRRVIETDLLGELYGAYEALRQFRRQGSGTLINNASMLARVGAPYQAAYTAAKFGIRGLSESLRQESLGTGIRVCTVMPASIDTPLFQHAANYYGRAAKALTPVHDPEQVARTIVRLAERPRDEVFVGSPGRLMTFTRLVARALADRMLKQQVEADMFQDRPIGPTDGNLFEPMREGAGIGGGWQAPAAGSGRRAALIGGGALAALGLVWLRGRSGLPLKW